MISGLNNINFLDLLLDLIMVPLPFFIMAYIEETSIGNRDVKVMAAIGFFIRIIGGVKRSIFSLIFAIVFMIAISRFKEISRHKLMSLAHFIALGYLLFI